MVFSKSVEVYSIQENSWASTQSLNIERSGCNSCILSNEWIYTFSGRNNSSSTIYAIERFNARKYTNSSKSSKMKSSWELINIRGEDEFAQSELGGRVDFQVAQIGVDEIAILGGQASTFRSRHSDGFIFNAKTRGLKKVIENNSF